jgi:NADH-quinone oxidoreductase subunit J
VFLFVVMLLNLRHDTFTPPRERLVKVAGVVFALGAAAAFLQLVPKSLPTVQPIPADFGGYAAVGRALYTDFVLPFEVSSLLLLAAIVGAVVLAKRRIG